MNVYEDSDVLPMAIRLRKTNRCPVDIDNIYGEIMVGIVHMASVLLPQEDPRYEVHRKEFLSDDVQSRMLCQALVAAEKYVDTTENPRRIVNYLVKTVQNRLRNYVRDTENRNAKLCMVSESELGYDVLEKSGMVMSLDGRIVSAEPTGRVTNFEID